MLKFIKGVKFLKDIFSCKLGIFKESFIKIILQNVKNIIII